MKRAAEKIKGFLYLILLAAAGLLTFPILLGWKPQVVLSGSMEPGIPVGSLVYIQQKTDVEEIRAGDVIAYRLGEKAAVLHRVVRVEEEERCFTTKGDANPAVDPGEVSFGQYMGKLAFCVPLAGYAAAAVQHPWARIVGCALVVLSVVIHGMARKRKRVMKDERI